MTFPKEATKYFWDVNPNALNAEQDADFIISRLLEYGDTDSVRWLFATYSSEQVKGVMKTAHGLSRKSGLFWQHFFAMDPNEILCLNKPFHNLPGTAWHGSVRAAS